MSTTTNTDEDEFKITRVIGNEILYYGEITNEDILEFIEEFKKLEIKLLKQKAELMGYEPVIRIHICSGGGDLFAGLSAMNILEKSRVKVVTIAQGECCSAATFFFWVDMNVSSVRTHTFSFTKYPRVDFGGNTRKLRMK